MVDERKGEPFELTSKTPWQRFQIFVAGAIMNLIIAFPIACLAYVVGKIETPNEVGIPGFAEAKAGIQPGDVILEVDGRKIDSLDKLRIEMIRRANGTMVPVKMRPVCQPNCCCSQPARALSSLPSGTRIPTAMTAPGMA